MKKNALHTVTLICWATLIFALIAKIFGADWFIAKTNNQDFINLCNYINDVFILNFLVRFIINSSTCTIYYIAIFQEKLSLSSLKWFIPSELYIILILLYDVATLFFILDIVIMVGLPILIKRTKRIAITSILGFI